jgi:kumamolisin
MKQKLMRIKILAKRLRSGLVTIFVMMLVGCASTLLAQTPIPGGTGTVATLPASSISNPSDAGNRVHTSLLVLAQFSAQTEVASQGFPAKPLYTGPPFLGYFHQTPASLACTYGLQAASSGCNPNAVYLNPNGGRNAIAIVDAYDDANAYADLQNFSGQFGVPAINPTSFVVAYAPPGGSTPG